MRIFNLCQAAAGRLLLVFFVAIPLFFHHGSGAVAATRDAPTPIPYPLAPGREEDTRLPTRAPQPAKAAEVVLSGWFTIIWGDGEPGSETAAKRYFLTNDNGEVIQIALDQTLAQSIGGALALNRRRVEIEGVWDVPPTTSVETPQLQVQSIRRATSRNASEAASGVGPVTGHQPWVSLLCKFADVGSEPNPLSYFQAMYGGTYPGLDHYWREQSDGLIDVGGSGAFGWYTLPRPHSYYVYDQNGDGVGDLDLARAATDCTAAADAHVYFPNYVGINLMFNASLDCCAWGGAWFMNRDGVSRYWYTTWEPPWGYQNLSVMGHEMGHGFGLPHSSGQYGESYDNEWDVMSNIWANCVMATDPVYGCLGQHTISYHKGLLGWIPAGRKYTALPGSSTTITLGRLALPQSDNYLMAQIPIGGSDTRFYIVEARQTVGYDVRLPGQGVIIHEVDTTRAEPAHVVDVDGNGDTGDEGAIWRAGESFVDSANGITVSVEAETATGFVVTIDLSEEPQVAVTSTWTADGDWNPKSHFNPGDLIQWVVNVENRTGAAVPVELTFDVRGPDGEEVVYWNGTVTTGPGTRSWGLPGVIAVDTDGRHTLVGSVRYQEDTSQASVAYLVAPANDNLEQALVVNNTSYNNTQNTLGATTAVDDPIFPCGSGNQGSASVWYRYTPGNNGTLRVHTEGSNYDTMLALWQGEPGDLTSVACDDDGGAGLTSALTAELEAATTYYLEIAQFGTGSELPGGQLALTIDFAPGAGSQGFQLYLPVVIGQQP